MRISKKALSSLALVSAWALLLTGCTSEAKTSHQIPETTLSSSLVQEINAAVMDAMQAGQASEAVIGVWSPQGDYVTTFQNGSSRDFNPVALFRAAQVNQPIMCAVVLDQVSKGELQLDREVARDIPRQTGIGDVTYGQLCDGSSSFKDFKSKYKDIYLKNPTRTWPQGQLIAESLIHGQYKWPGLDVHVSDTPAVLLAHALSVRASEPLRDLIEDTVFEPAEMFDTFIPRSSELTIDTTNSLEGVGFLPGPNCEAGLINFSEVSPTILDYAGNTVSNVSDIKSFYEHLFAGTFGGEAGVELLKTVKPLTNPKRDEDGNPVVEEGAEEAAEPTSFHGFGILKEASLWGQSGSLPGSATAAWHNPDTGFTVVVALNNSAAGHNFASYLAYEIAAISGVPGLTWEAEDMAALITEAAVCQDEPESEE